MNAIATRPNCAAMRQHLEHLFGGYLDGCHDGLVELSWTDTTPGTDGKYQLRHSRLFGTDNLDELVEEAARLNATPMCNVYIGAALRKPNTAPFGRSSDSDAYALTAAYVDLDDEGAADRCKHIYGKAKPTFIVVTGAEPYVRAQLWWKLDEPLTDPGEWSALLRGMAAAMKGDPVVSNPGRVMRLAGSIAWPVKPGRQVELTIVGKLTEPGQSVYAYAHLARLFPPVGSIVHVPAAAPVLTQTTNSLGFTQDKLTDGRERYMRDTLAACLVELIGTTGAAPTVEELVEAAWPQYERHVDFSRAGRGAEEFVQKAETTLRRFHQGKIRGLEGLDQAIAVYKLKAEARSGDVRETTVPAIEPPKVDPDPGPFQALELKGSPPERIWLVTEWIPAGTVCSIYGDGGVGKTLIAQQLIYAAALGRKWLGLDVPRKKALGVFCEDEREELHRRHAAITDSMGIHPHDPELAQVYLWPRVGFENILVHFDGKSGEPRRSAFFTRLMETVLAHEIELLILDTAADLFGGNEIQRNQVNYFIKAVCGEYVRKAKEKGYVLTVVILAHPSQAGRSSGSGESGSTGWSNAVRSRLYLTKPENGLPEQRILTRKKSNYSAAGDEVKIDLIWDKGVIVPESDASDKLAIESAIINIARKVHAAFERGQPYGGHAGYDNFIGKRMIEELPGTKARIIGAAISEMKRRQILVSGAKTSSGDRQGYKISADNFKELGIGNG